MAKQNPIKKELIIGRERYINSMEDQLYYNKLNSGCKVVYVKYPIIIKKGVDIFKVVKFKKNGKRKTKEID